MTTQNNCRVLLAKYKRRKEKAERKVLEAESMIELFEKMLDAEIAKSEAKNGTT